MVVFINLHGVGLGRLDLDQSFAVGVAGRQVRAALVTGEFQHAR
jgi:hypothetical protein